MSLFISKNQKTEIFISVWEWCPTWCQSCSQTIKKNKNYGLKDIQNQIEIWDKISDKNFVFFLYWTNNLENDKIFEIIKYIKQKNRNIRLQIPLEAKKEQIDIFKNLTHEFVISSKIDNKIQLIKFLKSLKDMHKNNFIINYDLLIKNEYIKILEKSLKIEFEKNDDLTYSKKLWNIFLNLRELYFINSKEKKVENLKIKSCFAYESFEIKDNNILINDHLEIDKNLNVIFHNPLCFIWNNKITNLKQTNEKIISDFKKYKNHYLAKLNSDFEKNCFKCIQTWFRYDDN